MEGEGGKGGGGTGEKLTRPREKKKTGVGGGRGGGWMQQTLEIWEGLRYTESSTENTAQQILHPWSQQRFHAQTRMGEPL